MRNETDDSDRKKKRKWEIEQLDAEIKAMEKAKKSIGRFLALFSIGVATDN